MSLIHSWSFSESHRDALFFLFPFCEPIFYFFFSSFCFSPPLSHPCPLIMLTSPNSSTSSVSSEPRSPPYQQPTRRSPMPIKYPRFYSSPVDEDTNSTPLQVYGLEQREPSIYCKPPKLLRRVSHALGDIREDLSLDTEKLKRRSTVFFEPVSPRDAPPATSDGPRSRPMSIISFDNWSGPTRGMSQRISRRLSVFSSRGKPVSSKGGCISSPNLIGSSTQYASRSQNSFI
ncbi:unnamed protein product [Penicillium salamii]|uniref:Uncharacterized protein n=1 Tax=Penicillium salamii TaxID=1612424 RepID=A0A9W4JXF4_9EURO|nr:unnamed protein product [Penicillium salamii]CAG8189409.1 unnamed protein product [Penicillium salamii]CAG8248757.1 unnamed protein product [Penicillium salamii]CAG8251986.1 unnamed protein product [Penicillium salamii]CAG8275837.1 unnamed protein product [Penicillium salamii]